MKPLILIPATISSLRIAALPLFFILFTAENTAAALVLLAFCAATDFFDGYMARKLHVTSRFGTYYDATTDFFLMLGIYFVFFAGGYYPMWLLILIVAAFTLFISSSLYTKKIYDPIGRYIGSALYIGIVLTLLSPTQPIFIFVQYAFLVFFCVSLASRIISLTRKPASINPPKQ